MKNEKPMSGTDAAKLIFRSLQTCEDIPASSYWPLVKAVLHATGDSTHKSGVMQGKGSGNIFAVRKLSINSGRTQYRVIFELNRQALSVFLINYRTGEYNAVLIFCLGQVKHVSKIPLMRDDQIPYAGKPADRSLERKLQSLLCIHTPRLRKPWVGFDDGDIDKIRTPLTQNGSPETPSRTNAVAHSHIPDYE